MLSFFRKKPVIIKRKDHCISRKNIDSDAVRVLYRLYRSGYQAYLVGGGVRDLLLGRQPKDFDVGTNARPNEIKRLFRNCFLIGRRFRLAHIVFGKKTIETTTFRKTPATSPDSTDKIQYDDNTFGTPEQDAYRRDFTINGIFYDISDFSVIDYVGGLKDLKKKVIRTIGNASERFQEDPVRMMRAIKFAARLEFTFERQTLAALKKYHSDILKASPPRVCEEIFRLFLFGSGERSMRLAYEVGLLSDIFPRLTSFIHANGKDHCEIWKYLKSLDEDEDSAEVSNGVRLATLFYATYLTLLPTPRSGEAKRATKMHLALELLSSKCCAVPIPKVTVISAIEMFTNIDRFNAPVNLAKSKRFLNNADFKNALAFARIVARAENRPLEPLNEWKAAFDSVATKSSQDEMPHRPRRRSRNRARQGN